MPPTKVIQGREHSCNSFGGFQMLLTLDKKKKSNNLTFLFSQKNFKISNESKNKNINKLFKNLK